MDADALRSFLEANVPIGEDGPFALERHQAGHSNETFFVTWGKHDLVLRRPPRGVFLPTAHDVLREHRVLVGLADQPVRTPRPLVACEDESVIGAPFYLMERVDGAVVRHRLPERYEEARHHEPIADELIDALAELHGVDWETAGLEGIGKPSGYLERQVSRWSDQWGRTREHTEAVRAVPALDEVGDHLRDNLPETQRTTIVHGDYKLDNVVLSGDPPSVRAILDWEMATLGDPLADLGYLVSFWREARDPQNDLLTVEPRFTEAPSFPARRHLVERYNAATGLAVDALSWYATLATWKLAILLEGSYARHLAGKTDDPFFAEMEHAVPALAARALAYATGEREI